MALLHHPVRKRDVGAFIAIAAFLFVVGAGLISLSQPMTGRRCVEFCDPLPLLGVSGGACVCGTIHPEKAP